jgi:hypothetical protein
MCGHNSGIPDTKTRKKVYINIFFPNLFLGYSLTTSQNQSFRFLSVGIFKTPSVKGKGKAVPWTGS